MRKILRLLWKVVKWLLIALAVLVILVFLIAKVPAIQRIIINQGIEYFNKKTGGELALTELSLNLPFHVGLEGVSLKNPEGVEMASIDELDIHLGWRYALDRTVRIDKLELRGLDAHVAVDSDGGANYDFILQGFADSTATNQPPDTAAGKGWDFSLGTLELRDIHARYSNALTGDSIGISLGNLAVDMDAFSLNDATFLADDITLENSNIYLRLATAEEDSADVSPPTAEGEASAMPRIGVNHIRLKNNRLEYAEANTANRYVADLGLLEVDADRIDVSEARYDVDRVALSNSEVFMVMEATPPDTTATDLDPFMPMSVKLQELTLDRVSFRMNSAGHTGDSLALSIPNLEVADIAIDSNSYALNLVSLRGRYNGYDRLQNLSAKLSLSRRSAAIDDLSLDYGTSRVRLDIELGYPSLGALADQQAFDNLDARLMDITLSPDDIRHFQRVLEVPDSARWAPREKVSLQARINGSAERLDLKEFNLTTGHTAFNATAKAEGSSWDDKTYSLANLKVRMAREDILPFTSGLGLDTAMVPPTTDLQMTGKYGPGTVDFDGDIATTYGDITLNGKGQSTDRGTLPLSVAVKSEGFGFGRLLSLGDTLSAPFVLDADIPNLYDTTSFSATVNLGMDSLRYAQTTLHNIQLDARYDDDVLAGTLAVRDTFAIAELQYSATLADTLRAQLEAEIQGIDLQGLRWVDDDIRGQFDLSGNYTQTETAQRGNLAIDNILFIRDGERTQIDPIQANFLLGPDSTVASLKSPFADLHSVSNRSPEDISLAIANLLGAHKAAPGDTEAYWRADLSVKQTDILPRLILPDLKTFEPAEASARFDASKALLDVEANFPKIVYGSFTIDSLRLSTRADSTEVVGEFGVLRAAMDTLAIKYLSLKSKKIQDGTEITFRAGADSLGNKYFVRADLVSDRGLEKNFKLQIADSVVLNQEAWQVDPANNFTYGPDGLALTKLLLHRDDRQLEFNKLPEESTTRLTASNFPLSALSGILSTQQELLTGALYGDLNLRANGSFSGEGRIDSLAFAQADFGRLTWRADKTVSGFDIDVRTKGDALAFALSGGMTPLSETATKLDLNMDLHYLKLSALPEIAPDLVQSGKGSLVGNIEVTGNTSDPILNGELGFEQAALKLVGNTSEYRLGDEKIVVAPTKISIDDFTVLDSAGHTLRVNGDITHQNFGNLRANLSVRSKEFELIDVKPGTNDMLYGRLVANLDIEVNGRLDAPDVEADIGITPKTDLVFTVPESDYEDSFDESLVEWTDFDQKKPEEDILTRDKEDKKTVQYAFANTVRMNGSLKIDPDARFKVVIDSLAGDYLEIQGGGDIGISYDRTGNLRLSGSYEVADGFYQMTFYNLVKKKFDFQKGSRLTWNGGPTEANADITAVYNTRASVANLMMTDAGATSNNPTYSEKLPFQVLMHIRGELMEPEIAFDIVLAPDAKGALGGAVEAKLAQLRQNESDMNKQVFALLVLNTFLGASGGDDNFLSNQARNSASQILSQQLNRLSDRLITGVDVNFNLQSYGGAAGEGNTDLNIDIAKSFANDRVIVRVGSTIALEDSRAAGSQSQEMMTNVTVEYKITPDGRYRFKAYRENNLEDIVVGRITRTGAGILFQRDFDRFNVLFKKESDEGDASRDEGSNEAGQKQKEGQKSPRE